MATVAVAPAVVIDMCHMRSPVVHVVVGASVQPELVEAPANSAVRDVARDKTDALPQPMQIAVNISTPNTCGNVVDHILLPPEACSCWLCLPL